jgi:hypothetical protein
MVFAACGGGPTTASGGASPSPPTASSPTPAPTPAPTADANGVWLVEAGDLEGYGIDVTQTGTKIAGRSIFPVRDVTGPLNGTVTAAGHVTWVTAYGNDATDAVEGDIAAGGTTIEGRLTFDIPSAHFHGGTNIVLTLQHR